MNKHNILDKMKNLLFGDYKNISLQRKIHILLNFITIIIVIIGTVSNVIIDMEPLANVVNLIALTLLTVFFLFARNSKYHNKVILPLFFTSLILMTLAWFTNGGYNGNIGILFFVYFLAIFAIVPNKSRLLVFTLSIVLFSFLVACHYYYPELIVQYSNESQRFVDMFFGGILYLIFMFTIVNVILESYSLENIKIKNFNKELSKKNDEISKSNQLLKESSERFSIVMSASSQVWFEYAPDIDKLSMGNEFPAMLGYAPDEIEMTMQAWMQLVHPEDIRVLQSKIYEAIQSGETVFYEYRVKDKNGDWHWLQTTGKLIYDTESHRPPKILGIHKDISNHKKVEQSLVESEEKYRALVNNSMEGILILSLDGTILFANNAIGRIFKLNDIDFIIGKKVFEFIDPESIPKVIQDFANIMQGKDSYVSEYKSFTISGEELWLESIGKVITYEGSLADLVSLRDVTDRKKAERILHESEAKYHNLFDTMPNGFYRTTPDGYFVDANPAFINMLGYDSLEDLKQVHIPSELYVHSTERDEIFNDNSEFNEQIEIYRLRCKDGKIIWLEDSARYIKDDDENILYHEGICKDITERKEAEAKLREYAEELKELNATKDKFFSIIAHDLINPLGTFRDMARLLYDEYDTFNEAERKEFLVSIKESSKQVYVLLENLLEWSRSQRGLIKFNPDQVDLHIICQNAVYLLNLTSKNKHIEILNNIPINTNVFADANLINTVLRNLISNAVKFTPYGGLIEIGLLENNISKDYTTIFVKDNGVGLEQDSIRKIFKIDNEQTSLGTSGEKGTGIGLILCKEFVDKHNGKIWVESKVGNGSTFYVSLPNIIGKI